jgi:hypothetical protein
MSDTLTARDKYHLKKYGSVDSPVRLAMKNGGRVVEHRDALLKQFGGGGFFSDIYDAAKKTASNVYNEVKHDAKEAVGDIKNDVKPYVNTVRDISEDIIFAPINRATESIGKLYDDAKMSVSNIYGVSEKSVGDVAPFKYNTKGVYDFNQNANITSKNVVGGVNRDAYKDICKTSKAGTPECATAVTNNALKTNGGGYVSKYNLRGSGWQMIDNIANSGGQKMADIFDQPNKPKSYNLGNIKKFITTESTRPEHADSIRNNIQPGDVTSLYFPKSSNYRKAYRETGGESMNTHVGDVVEINGKKFIRDNVHGKYNYRPLEQVLGNKDKDGVLITGFAKPESKYNFYDSNKISVSPNINSKDNPTFENLFSKSAVRALSSIEKNKDSIINTNKISADDFDLVKNIAHAVMLKESNYGKANNNATYNFTSGRSPVGGLAMSVKKVLSSIGLSDEESIGLGNVKLKENYTPEELKVRGFDAVINSGNREAQESPEFSGVVTADHIARTLTKVKSLLSQVPVSIRNDKDLLASLVSTAHNQGLDNIEKDIESYIKTKDANKLMQYKEFDYPKSVRTLNSYIVKKK